MLQNQVSYHLQFITPFPKLPSPLRLVTVLCTKGMTPENKNWFGLVQITIFRKLSKNTWKEMCSWSYHTWKSWKHSLHCHKYLMVQCVTCSLKELIYTWKTLASSPVWFYQSGWWEKLVQSDKYASVCKLHRNWERWFRGCTFSELELISKWDTNSKFQA